MTRLLQTQAARNLILGAAVISLVVSCDEGTEERAKPNTTTWELLSWRAAQVKAPKVYHAGPASPKPEPSLAEPAPTVQEQRKVLFQRIRAYFGYSSETMSAIETIFGNSKILSQGNPAVTVHPMTREQCFAARNKAHLPYVKDSEICQARNMSPLYNPKAGQTAKDAPVCIDQYEFPDIPCEYPVVRVSAREAAQLCEAVGKRLCDAHEWEGACAGQLRAPEDEYAWGQERQVMKGIHNHNREIVWAYGKTKDFSLCAMSGHKTEGCNGGSWKHCGSNTFPCGAFPKCLSSFGVYDQHGNAAEHMSLPMSRDELARPGHYGQTEMKGSWFIFQSYEAHDDDCRWRAPDWHASKVMDINSHSNYHLGFRCCKDVKKRSSK